MVDQSQKCELIELIPTTRSSNVPIAMGIFLELDMKLIRSAKICSAALLASMLLTPAAFADSGFFIGGSVGNASVSASDLSLDDTDSAYKGFVGYIVDMPVVDFGIEAAYVDFGAPSDTILGDTFALDVTGLSAFGTVGLDWGLFGIFGKVGMVSWDADITAFGETGTDSGTDTAYGVGFRLTFSSIEVRAEIEQFDVEGNDVEMISVGALWRF